MFLKLPTDAFMFSWFSVYIATLPAAVFGCSCGAVTLFKVFVQLTLGGDLKYALKAYYLGIWMLVKNVRM